MCTQTRVSHKYPPLVTLSKTLANISTSHLIMTKVRPLNGENACQRHIEKKANDLAAQLSEESLGRLSLLTKLPTIASKI